MYSILKGAQPLNCFPCCPVAAVAVAWPWQCACLSARHCLMLVKWMVLAQAAHLSACAAWTPLVIVVGVFVVCVLRIWLLALAQVSALASCVQLQIAAACHACGCRSGRPETSVGSAISTCGSVGGGLGHVIVLTQQPPPARALPGHVADGQLSDKLTAAQVDSGIAVSCDEHVLQLAVVKLHCHHAWMCADVV